MGAITSFGQQLRDFLAGLTRAESTGESAIERHNAETVRLLYEKFNENDLDAGARLLSADYEGLDVPSGEVVRGRAGWRRRQEANRGPLPDATTVLKALSVNGDLAVAEVINRGTHTRPFPLPTGGTVAPSGRKIEALSCEIYVFRDGLIARGRLYYDFLTVARQLGLSA
jgi:ketosteroid isomerase-like protein